MVCTDSQLPVLPGPEISLPISRVILMFKTATLAVTGTGPSFVI